jgi:chemotaxis regulatin CheY-phosphate phosphatase CheZ
LDARLDSLARIIQEIRVEIQHSAAEDITKLSKAAQDMMNGRVYQHVDIQAKGELGVIVRTFNQTLANLQQLDASVKDQSTKVPELAAQLDAITADTEQATQNVMNRLDNLMARVEEAGSFFADVKKHAEEYKVERDNLLGGIADFLKRAKKGENIPILAQEILDYTFAFEVSQKPELADISDGQTILQSISDEAFEILNLLQFQDITRQKVEKIVLMLKQFRLSLDRLLAIFNIAEESESTTEEVFEKRKAATQDHIFDTSVSANTNTDSVDDIIAKFKTNN